MQYATCTTVLSSPRTGPGVQPSHPRQEDQDNTEQPGCCSLVPRFRRDGKMEEMVLGRQRGWGHSFSKLKEHLLPAFPGLCGCSQALQALPARPLGCCALSSSSHTGSAHPLRPLTPYLPPSGVTLASKGHTVTSPWVALEEGHLEPGTREHQTSGARCPAC